jgi:DIM1 family U5 snRNP protein
LHVAFLPLQEEDRVVIIRFGHDYDESCMQMDEVRGPVRRPPASRPAARSRSELETFVGPAFCQYVRMPSHAVPKFQLQTQSLQVLAGTAERMKNFAVIYLVDISEVPDFNAMYELYDPCTVMFFFRNKVSWARAEGRQQ